MQTYSGRLLDRFPFERDTLKAFSLAPRNMLAGQWRSRKPWPVDGHVCRTLQDAAMFSGLQGYHTLLFLSSLYSPLPLSSPSRSDSSTDASSCEKPRFTSLPLLSFSPSPPCQQSHTERQKSEEEKGERGKTFVAEAVLVQIRPN